MPDAISEATAAHAVNSKIAKGYDLVPYDPVAIPAIDPERAFGLAALYGGAPHTANFDVLDLGCGTGGQLDRVAAMTGGRLIGTDLSHSACERARARCAKHGERCQILGHDFIDLDAQMLGQFDLIYNVGVLYVTPPAVQQRILELIAACLKPKGVAVVSYYSGTVALLTAGVHQILKATADPQASPDAQVRAGRARIQEIGEMLSRRPGDHRLMMAILQQIYGHSDPIFFHEMLNQSFSATCTSALEAALSPGGVHFLNWMTPDRLGLAPLASTRALMADAIDLAGGGYHFAAFGKCGGSQGPDPKAPHLLWQSALSRTGADAKTGLGVYRDASLGLTVTAGSKMIEAVLDVLAAKPADWKTLAATTEIKRDGRGAGAHMARALEKDFLGLWQHGLVTPLWTPSRDLGAEK